jgi:hypothetical protein
MTVMCKYDYLGSINVMSAVKTGKLEMANYMGFAVHYCLMLSPSCSTFYFCYRNFNK